MDIDAIFGSEACGVYSTLNIEGQHRSAVAAAKSVEQLKHDVNHKHDHAHSHEDHAHR